MKPIRILQLIASSRGGGAVHVRDLALGLPSASFAVQVAMPEDGGAVGRTEFDSARVPFHGIAISQGLSLRALSSIRTLASTADVLHVHGSRAALFGRMAAMSLGRRRPRVVFTIHGFAAPHYPFPRRQILLLLERAFARVTDAWVCVSHAEQQSLAGSGVAQSGRTFVIQNGIDVARFTPSLADRETLRQAWAVGDAETVVTTVCRLYRPRDVPTLLLAYRRAVEGGLTGHLLVVGDGPLRPALERQVSDLGLHHLVHLLGLRRDVAQILGASDIFVLSSRGWEGLPLTVLEAMAAQLPVIASDVGGTREAVVHGETGYLCVPGDVESLAEHLVALARNRAVAAEIGGRGRRRVERLFTVQRMVAETAELYRTIVHQSAPPSGGCER